MKMRVPFIMFLLLVCSAVGVHADIAGDFAGSRGVNTDNTALLVSDLSDGSVLVEYNAEKPLIPASILKCVTNATLLSKHDVDYRFHTLVYITGPVRDGVLEGNVMVVGSGDPSLNSRHIKNNKDICVEIATALESRGVKEIRGRIVTDEDLWDGPATPPSWARGDLPHDYGTGSHGLNFEDNASGSRSVANPAAVFVTRLRSALNTRGITVVGETLREEDRRLLVDHESVPLDEIMRSCMMRSDNQYAEALLRTLAVAAGHKGETEKAAALEKSFWKKHKAPMENVTIIDGSGLSRQNRVTARFMEHVLRERASDPYYASFFPIAGEEGTLRRFLVGTPLEGYVAMKTGSMNGIQCYAGYKLDDEYAPTHIIVVMMNEMSDRAAAREALKKALLRVFFPEKYDKSDAPADSGDSIRTESSDNN